MFVPLSIRALFSLFGRVLRNMKPVVFLTAIMLLVATPTADAASRMHQKGLECHLPQHAHILSADSQALVYETVETMTSFGGVIYGCTYARKGIYRLGEPIPNIGTPKGIEGIRLETLDGPIVAYEFGFGNSNGAAYYVVVRDLRNGRLLHRVVSGPAASPRVIGSGPITAIAIASNGDVAWIAENDDMSTREMKYYEVHAVDRSGNRVLASGSDVKPNSLAQVGSLVYWSQGEQPESATLD
jgi:hypothetical protein